MSDHHRRGSLEIALTILKTARKGDLLYTHMLYECNLNSTTFDQAIMPLLAKKLVVIRVEGKVNRLHKVIHLTKEGYAVSEHWEMILLALH